MDVQDDERLMERVRARDTAAFESLYDSYHRLVYGVAYRMLGTASAAEDITQGVFLKVWSSPELFVSGNFPGWIVRMTRNKCLDALRAKSNATAELPADLPGEEPMEDRAFAAIDAARVRSALALLAPEQREPIEMGFFGGLTHDEIARRTGIPLGTVKTRIRSGLRRLRESLADRVSA